MASPRPLPGPPDLFAEYDDLARREGLLPVKVSGFYRQKVEEELAALGGLPGPLYRVVHPVAERLFLIAPGEVADFVDDRSNMPAPADGPASSAVIHKYADRVLFMPTAQCASHCLYCFRQDVLSEQHGAGGGRLDADLDALSTHLDRHPGVREVILSGGDPLMLPLRELEKVLERIAARVDPPDIRIHSRAVVFAPQLLEDSDRVRLLARSGARVILHIVHPYEICAHVAAAIEGLRAAGIRLYNHFPLLRGINDHALVLKRLIGALDELNVRTLSIYIPEPVRHSAPYRLPLARIFALQDELSFTSPSWINAVRFTLDSPVGKVRREHLSGWDITGNTAIFTRQGREVRYPDFPTELDVPGEIATLLWKG